MRKLDGEAGRSDGRIGRSGQIDRRQLLRGAGAAAVSASLAAPALGQTGSARRRILVLGAGMAGLTAALALRRQGHDVTVLEYQDRVGGRLLSRPLGGGMFSEAGGGHFRSNMPYVLAYLRHFGLPLLSLNDGVPRYMVGGAVANGGDLVDWPWPLSPEERNVTISGSLNRYLYRAGFDADTVLDRRWPDEEAIDRLANVTVGDLVRGVGASDAFCRLLDAHAGIGTSEEAALGMVPRFAYHFGDKNLFRVQGGNDRLPKALAGALGLDRIVLNAPVALIDQAGRDIRVATRDGREFLADAVVSTIPSSVLGEIEVRPAWSAEKTRLFAATEWSNTVKVIVKTRTPVWLEKDVQGWPMAGGDRPWERIIDITGNEPGGHGNAFFYLNGPNAAAVLARPPAERAEATVAQFRADMPDLIGEVLASEVFAWPDQPWVKASFSNLPLGGGWMMREWSRPEGRIHFAGDFTTMKSGWVEGAIESGLRAARQLDPLARPEGRSPIRQEL